jgi:PAS domain S-box-containing protein
MSTPSNGSSSSDTMRYEPQQPQGDPERPKLFMLPPHMPNDYGHQLMQLHHAPQPGAHYYAPPPPTLHVSSDLPPASSPSVTPSSGARRSREDLNLKEKQRMLKLNERIAQLKTLLDEAGVSTKKNKQSVLDNTAHYIDMLRGDLQVAQQKAERAEKQAEAFRSQAQKGPKGVDKAVRGVFDQTTTPRVVLDMDMNTVMFNTAFAKHTGLAEAELKRLKTPRPYICEDEEKLDFIVKKLQESKRSMAAVVKASTGDGSVAVNLVAAVVTDDRGKPTNVEFSLIPVETPAQRQTGPPAKRRKTRAANKEKETTVESSTAESDKQKDQPSIYVQL